MSVAAPDQMRDVVERWARINGYLTRDQQHRQSRKWTGPWGVEAYPLEPRGTFLCSYENEFRGRELSMPVALAWCLLVELHALSMSAPVDVEPCRLCVQREIAGAQARLNGGTLEWPTPCPACLGRGHSELYIANALIAPAERHFDSLAVHADRLAAINHPAALPIAWALRWSSGDGELEGTGEAVMLLHWAAVAREQRAGGGTIVVGDFTYTDPGPGFTLSRRVAALNAQGGPLMFSVASGTTEIVTDGGSIFVASKHAGGWTSLPTRSDLPPVGTSVPYTIGDGLGRRLGRRIGVR